MSDTKVWPTELRLSKDKRTLTVTFEGGQSFALPAELLRVLSPSAEVQGHSPEQRQTVPGKKNVCVLEIVPVGNYAVRLGFDDLHSTGIYSWDYLHRLGCEHNDLWAGYLAELEEKGLALLTDQFDAEHEKLFTFKLGDGHEILMIRAVVKARSGEIAQRELGDKGLTLADCRLHDTRFYYDGSWHDAIIYDRKLLHEGMVVPGPAIVSEMESTTLVLPGYAARVDAIGNLLINPAVA